MQELGEIINLYGWVRLLIVFPGLRIHDEYLDVLFAVNLFTDAAFEEPLSCATIFLAQVIYLS